MTQPEWSMLDIYDEPELTIIKSILDDASIPYRERMPSEGEVLRLYTSSSGPIDVEIWVRPEDLERARELLKPIE